MNHTRREWLSASLGAFGGMALSHQLASADEPAPRAAMNGGLHHPAKAKRIVQIFLNGGASQMDTFDFKPELERRHGQTVDVGLKATATGTPGPLMK